MKKKHFIIISFAVIMLLIGIDQLTKWLCNTNETLLSGDKIEVIKNFISFRLAYNKGAAWSILEGHTWLLVAISLIASIAVSVLVVKLVDFKKSLLLSIALILIDAGSIGNLIDRAFYKDGVIDFLYLEFMEFPTFNFADSCLTVGAIILMVYVIFIYEEPIKKTPKNYESGEEVNA